MRRGPDPTYGTQEICAKCAAAEEFCYHGKSLGSLEYKGAGSSSWADFSQVRATNVAFLFLKHTASGKGNDCKGSSVTIYTSATMDAYSMYTGTKCNMYNSGIYNTGHL